MPEHGLLVRGAVVVLLCLLISQAPSTSCAPVRTSGGIGSCITSERDALLSFKASLLDPAGHLSSWQGEECCQWKGVRCNNGTGHVVKLNLRNTDFDDIDYIYDPQYGRQFKYQLSLSRGEMSSSLAALQNLRYLDLSCNDFNGTSVPMFVGSLKNLKYLNLSYTNFFGRIPYQLGNLSNLQYLDLSHNDFNGTSIPVFMGSFKNLRYLNLAEATFSGRIPSQLGNLSNLQSLDMSFNCYSGYHFHDTYAVDLAWLPRLSLLSHLDMTLVDLSSVRDWVHMVNMLPALQVLRLSACHLNSTASVISQSNLTHLEVLDLSYNFFDTSLEHSWIWDLTSLKELYLSGWQEYGNIPNEVLNTTYLEVTDLSGSGLIPNNLDNLCSLQTMVLAGNNINADIGEFMLRLPKCSWNTLRELDLGNTNMTGRLPIWIGNMTNLRFLGASRNNLIGSLPAGVGSLSNLKVLDLSHNNFSGLVPVGVRSLSNLKMLDLSDNNFSGPILVGVGSLSNLEVLGLGYNKFSGPVPVGVGSLSNLKVLDLSHNKFSGPLPVGVGALSNLEVLDLSYNKFSGLLTEEHFAGLLNLEYLDLSYNSFKLVIEPNWVPPFRLKVARFQSCQLGPHFPEWLRWQTAIDVLVLGNANLDDVIPDWFWVTFSRASFLHASGNMLHGSLPANLQHMWVDRMYLGSNKFTGQVPQLPISISHVNLSSNSFSGSFPSDLKAPRLEELLLANNQITGTIPSSMCQLTNLKRLDLSGNNLTGDVVECWKEPDDKSSVFNTNSADQFGCNLLSLALNNNDLTGEFPKFLRSASQLKFVDLSYNRFFGRLPEWLPEKMPHLQIMRLRSNMFSGHIPKNLTCLDSLHYLDIASNNISGTIPRSLSKLKAMTVISQNTEDYIFEESIPVITKDQKRDYTFEIYKLLVNLDLSSNSLTGQIPQEINLLIGLTNLNLSSNQLIGTIPSQMGDLKHLESLDLSYNEFSGEIPSSLSALTSLSHLNLSYNNLSGAIPSGPQLQALDNQIYIYIGNPGLCGHPLSKNCSTNDAKQSVHEDRDHVAFLYLGMGIGFWNGLWTVFCTMLMKRTWTIAYFQIIDKLYDKFYVQVAISWARLMKKTQDDAP